MIVDSQHNKHNLIGLISLKDIFEVMIQKELGDDDIHQTLTVQNFLKRLFKNLLKFKGNYVMGNRNKKVELKDFDNQDLLNPLIKK